MLSEPSRGCRIATGLHLRRGVPALVDDFHRNALLQPPARRSENPAEGFGCAPIVTDHPTDVFRMMRLVSKGTGRNARGVLTTLRNGAIWAEGTQAPLTAVPQKTTNRRPAGDQT